MTSHWFEPLADHLGEAYLRYSFTRGTSSEVDALWSLLGLEAGRRVLDVGCGPGRHAHELARRGVEVVGADISARFVSLAAAGAPAGARFVRADARHLPFAARFDAAVSLCQGAFGLNRMAGPGTPLAPGPDPDLQVLSSMASALRPGGRLALTAFSAYFQVRWLEDHDSFDPATGCNHERTVLLDPDGNPMEADLWTTCFTPRELRSMVDAVGLRTVSIWSVGPGDYTERPPDLDHPELLVVAERPA